MEKTTEFKDVWHQAEALRIAVRDGYIKPGLDEQSKLLLAAEIERLRVHAVVLAETARQVERERCAKLCEDWASMRSAEHGGLALRNVAERIRGA